MKKLKQKKISIPQPDGTSKRVSIYYRTIEELDRKTEALFKESENRKTFELIADDWFEAHRKEISPYTEQCYIAPLRDCKSEFGTMFVSDITAERVQQFITFLAKQKFARQTIKLRLTVLTQVFDYAIIKGLINYNPTAAVKIPSIAKKKERQLPAADDIQRVKDNVADEFGLIPFMALYTGMRKGEILALDWKDIDFKNKTISINKTVVYVDGKPVLKDTPKSVAGIRKVPLLKPLEKELKKRKQKSGFVIEINGNTPTRSEYHCMEKKYKRVHGISLCLHQLRHEFATIIFLKGINMKPEGDGLFGIIQGEQTKECIILLGYENTAIAAEKSAKILSEERIIKEEISLLENSENDIKIQTPSNELNLFYNSFLHF